MRKAFINEPICLLFGSILFGAIFYIIGSPIIHDIAGVEWYYWMWDGWSFIWMGHCLIIAVGMWMIFMKLRGYTDA